MASKTTDLSGVQKNDVTTMQGVNSIICSQTPANNDTVYFLIDDRINYTSNTKFSYRIKKLGDRCWMTQNLAIQGGTSLNSTYSNIQSAYAIPGSNNNASSRFDRNSVRNNSDMYNGTHIDNTIDSYSNNTGGYYSYYVSTATTSASITTDYHNTTYDICPSMWHLPTWNGRHNGQTTGEGDLYELMGKTQTGYYATWSSAGYYSAFDDGYVSLCVSGGCPQSSYANSHTHFWSSTIRSSTSVYNMWTVKGSGGIWQQDDNRRGHSIRCVAK